MNIKKNNVKKIAFKYLKSGIFRKILLILFCLLAAVSIEMSVYKPNLGTFIGSGMDSLGNMYVLGVNEKKNLYKITKFKKNGVVEFEKKLQKYDEENNIYNYKNIEVDGKGNYYLLRQLRSQDAVVSEISENPISNEAIIMFDTWGNQVKNIANFTFPSVEVQPSENYIRKIQIVDQNLKVITCLKNVVSVSSINVLTDDMLVTNFSFEITPSVVYSSQPEEWLNDAAVLSTGKIVYANKGGELLMADDTGEVTNLKQILPNAEVSITGISIDLNDNLYFTNLLTGNFYKFNSKTMSISLMYNLESSVDNSEIRLKDLRRIRILDDGDFYAASKNFKDLYGVRLGNNPLVVKNLRYSIFFWGILIILGITLILFGLIMLIKILIKRGVSRVPLAMKITFMFLPVFIILTSLLILTITVSSTRTYKEVLESYQNTGAQIVADSINGDDLDNILSSFNFNSVEYAQLNSKIRVAYEDLKNKVHDKSDYIVIYGVAGGKIYSIANVKYSKSSKSYADLNFADPDMVIFEAALADCLLERDEIKLIHAAYESLSKGDKDVHASFNDVHGKLEAYFAPIKNSQDSVVGFAGNFLDENIHLNREIFNIFMNSLYLISAAMILIFLYLCYVVWHTFMPLRVLKKGINSMIHGNWGSKVEINSKDEIQDIAISFNDMSERIEKYTSNLVSLNEQYLRFVPKELLNLLGKHKITQVNVNDHDEATATIIYASFNIDFDNLSNFAKSKSVLFKKMSDVFAQIFSIVENNKGIIHNFSGLNSVFLFPNSSEKALLTMIQISELYIEEKLNLEIRMALGHGRFLIGVMGINKRCEISLFCNELLNLININAHMHQVGIQYAATQNFINSLAKDTKFNKRFIGKCGNITGNSNYNLYEILDPSEEYQKGMIELSRKKFESAVNNFYDSNYEIARNLVSSVIKINNNDKVAMFYLKKCDAIIKKLQLDPNILASDSDLNLF
ncbi:MAG: HAMP domain-containing protein [Candidatus Improbicoccus devescovinae]|nr:MAG: HAMP domain-containing protein [Candidatus Improbicoccus devescovinae]